MRQPLHRPYALLVDRDAGTRELYAQSLRGALYEVEEAEDGHAALAKVLGGRRYDVIVTDTRLPGLNGYDLSTRIRRELNARDTTIVVVTSEGSPPSIERAYRAGADVVLVKPCLPETLLDVTLRNRELHTRYERARAESLTDPLTELPNRRFLLSHATGELARASRERYDVALLLADIDDIKSINDVYGHQAGDGVLKCVAGCLRRSLRTYDVCGRLAGDEFVLILSRCNAELAAKRAAELTAAVSRQAAKAGIPGGPPISIAVGAAVYPVDGLTYEQLIAAADARMYRQKRGRTSPHRETRRRRLRRPPASRA
jgi:diguanylate cyclase (GGDEF)-like protein